MSARTTTRSAWGYGPGTPVLSAVAAGREAAVRRRTRPGLWAAGVALVALGGLVAAGLVSRAGDRVEVRPGTLLTLAEVSDSAAPGVGEQLVGVAAKPGQLPARGLRPGDRVLAVPVPGDQASVQAGAQASSDGTAADLGGPVPAEVAQVGPADAEGAVTVDLVVGQDTGPRLAALASTDRVVLVLLPAPRR